MSRGLDPNSKYQKLEQMMYLLFVLDNADIVKSILIRANSVCADCSLYKQQKCPKNGLCALAIYSYLFHGSSSDKSSKTGQQKIYDWVYNVNNVFEETIGKKVIDTDDKIKSRRIFKLSSPPMLLLSRLYHSFGERLSLSWIVDWNVNDSPLSLLAWLYLYSKDAQIVESIDNISIGQNKIQIILTLKTRVGTKVEITLQDYSHSNFKYSIRWYYIETDDPKTPINILRWDNSHDEGYDTAPNHIHIHNKRPILPWKYYSDIRELIQCALTLIETIDKNNIDLTDKNSLKNEVYNFRGC